MGEVEGGAKVKDRILRDGNEYILSSDTFVLISGWYYDFLESVNAESWKTVVQPIIDKKGVDRWKPTKLYRLKPNGEIIITRGYIYSRGNYSRGKIPQKGLYAKP